MAIVFKDVAIYKRTEATLEFKRLAIAILPRIRSRITGAVLLRIVGWILCKRIAKNEYVLNRLSIKRFVARRLKVHTVSSGLEEVIDEIIRSRTHISDDELRSFGVVRLIAVIVE